MDDNVKAAPLFCGVGTALVTPFSGGRVDIPAARRLAKRQRDAGISALIVAGTTGESPTLSADERALLLSAVLDTVGGRIPVIMGTGANDTRTAVRYTEQAARLGADGALVVTPYYNKGTAEGLARHYLAVADATPLPIILYNVPSRTGVDLTLPVLSRLAEHPRIVAIKEASGKIDRVADIRAALGDRMPIYSGNDGDLLPTLSLGGIGIISVLSNLLPEACISLWQSFTAGRVGEAGELAVALTPLCRLLFAETNPAPIKCAMADRGLCGEELRLPMTTVTPTLRAALAAEVARFI